MNNTIVVNLSNGAVSEYDFAFQSITPHHAGSVNGLYSMGGEDDAGQPIAARIKTGMKHWGVTHRKFSPAVYFAMTGPGQGVMTLHSPEVSFAYPFPVRATGVSRAVAGRGFRENYVAVEYSNVAGADFRIDRIEALTAQSTRRI